MGLTSHQKERLYEREWRNQFPEKEDQGTVLNAISYEKIALELVAYLRILQDEAKKKESTRIIKKGLFFKDIYPSAGECMNISKKLEIISDLYPRNVEDLIRLISNVRKNSVTIKQIIAIVSSYTKK